uniref:hypothetical protein n=1 Tax=Holdemanella biformis TaxID=1735 RepID=UPI0026718F9C
IQWLYFHGLGGSATMEYSVTFILRKQDILLKEVLSFIMKKQDNFVKEVVSFLKKLLVSRKQ